MARVPDTAVQMSGRTVTVRLDNVPEVDAFTFYDPQPPSGNVAAVASFVMSYTKVGAPRQVRPTSSDPKSPFNWAGEMWKATGAVTFSAAYATGNFSVHGSAKSAPGSAKSAGDFGEMGTERNGYFLHH
jgi:hypothetical protein